MNLVITMRMSPFNSLLFESNSGNEPLHKLVHQILCTHEANDFDEFINELQGRDFVIVTEYYKDRQGRYQNRGEVALNTAHIGKIKEWKDHRD